MIEIKATKAAPEENAAERYVLKSLDKKSSFPLVFGAFVTGVALYVKSLFMQGPAQPDQGAAAAPKGPNDASNDRAQPAAHKWQVVSVNDDIETTRSPSLDTFDGGSERKAFAIRFAGSSVDLVDDMPFDFVKASVRSNWDAFAVSPILPTPSNDNHGPASPAASAPSGGSAGDGETTSKKPQDRDDDDEPDDEVINRAPRLSGPVYLRDVVGCATLVIALTDLLRNAEDPDGDTLTVTQLSVSSGTLIYSGAEWIYDGDAIGPVTLTYKVTDGHYSVQQTAYFSVVPQPPIIGDDSDNLLLGSMCADDIAGMGGDDNIDGRGGNDVIDGGAGHDHIVGGDGNDVIFARAGNDVVFGGAGDDQISGGDGHDRLFGEAGDDIIFGDNGDDLIDGGDGHDLLSGGAGNDLVDGGADDDTIEGGEGNDQLSGGSGNDLIAGNSGNDVIAGGVGNDVLQDGHGMDVVDGGSGDDTVIAAADAANDVFDGGDGHDTISYAEATEELTIDVAAGKASGIEIGEDSIAGFENVVGGQSDDVFVAGNDPVSFTGNGGNNQFVFGSVAPPEDNVVLHEIIDFKPGDLIKMSRWDIFEEVFKETEDQLETIYGDKVDDDDARIRYHRDEHNHLDKTVIEADLDGDHVYEIKISLHGNHALLIVENH